MYACSSWNMSISVWSKFALLELISKNLCSPPWLHKAESRKNTVHYESRSVCSNLTWNKTIITVFLGFFLYFIRKIISTKKADSRGHRKVFNNQKVSKNGLSNGNKSFHIMVSKIWLELLFRRIELIFTVIFILPLDTGFFFIILHYKEIIRHHLCDTDNIFRCVI